MCSETQGWAGSRKRSPSTPARPSLASREGHSLGVGAFLSHGLWCMAHLLYLARTLHAYARAPHRSVEGEDEAEPSVELWATDEGVEADVPEGERGVS